MLSLPTFGPLLLLALSLAPTRLRIDDAPQVAAWIAEAGDLEDATEDDRRLALVWAAYESAGRPMARSQDGLDCSLLQLRGVALDGHTCAELGADPVLSARLWLRYLVSMRARCGSTARGLGAMATGRCGGAPLLVARRCMVAGVTC